jgi:hypothetical protein
VRRTIELVTQSPSREVEPDGTERDDRGLAFKLTTRVVESGMDEHRVAHYAFTILHVETLPEGQPTQEMQELVDQMLKAATGGTAGVFVTERGTTVFHVYSGQAMMTATAVNLAYLTVLFPEEPIGVGAKRVVEYSVGGKDGVTRLIAATHELVAFDGNAGELTSALAGTAQPASPDEVSSGVAHLTFDLRAGWPIGSSATSKLDTRKKGPVGIEKLTSFTRSATVVAP